MDCSLHDFLKQNGPFSETQAAKILKDIVKGLQYSHSRGIIHRDLKLENILVKTNSDNDILDLKIADFGLSELISDKLTTGQGLKGSFEYSAPELFKKNQKFDAKVDSWSLGIMLHYLLFGKHPSKSNNIRKTIKWILHEDLDFNQTHWKGNSLEA